MERFDALIVGGGAVGMSTAYHLSREGVSVAVVEKESGPAQHQSGRNSGVIHAGYNPKPDTLKADYCIRGNQQLKEYCAERDVSVREGGILIVSRNDDEEAVLRILQDRGQQNGTEVRWVAEDEIADIEPFARGTAALQALDGASIDARGYVKALANDAAEAGATIFYDRRVDSINEASGEVTVITKQGNLQANIVVNAAGLHADKLAEELADDMRVIPFRGYYAELAADKAHMVNSHVYAAPDLNFPFLGVHLSKRTDGRVIVGPGAMLAFGREAYNFASFEGGGLTDMLSWPGFYKMMVKPEFRNLLRREIKKSLLVKEVGKEAIQLIPSLQPSDFVRSYAGNRAQLVDRYGNLVDDIVIRDTDRVIHVLNVVSPGLTCSLPFGKDLADRAIAKL